MTRLFAVIFLTNLSFSTRAQTDFFGRYNFKSENPETGCLILNCNRTFFMTDTMIITRDSSVTSVIKGNWKVRKQKTLLLDVDSIICLQTPVGNLSRLNYDIRNGQFYLQIQTRRQFNRQNKKVHSIDPGYITQTWKEYQLQKAKQNSNYFFMADIYNCK